METPVKNLVDAVELTSDDALLPLFECVVNSIISLKQSNVKKEERKILIQIFRGKPLGELGFENIGIISNIKITDNGTGFNDKNYKSFNTPLSQLHKENFGCKGLGRFTWLAAFQKIHIRSNYFEHNKWKYREFKFDTDDEIYDVTEKDSDLKKNETIVELINCNNPEILDKTAIDVKFIAYEIMRHCFIFYLNGDLPIIELLDENMGDPEIVNKLYNIFARKRERSFSIKNNEFKIYIMRTIKEGNRRHNYIHYCANSRVVGRKKKLNRINSLFSYPLTEEGQEYYLDIYVVSEFLNKNIYSSRNVFKIPSEPPENENFLIDKGFIISFQDIEKQLSATLEELFDTHAKETRDKNIEEIKQYIVSKAPRYRSLLRNKEYFNTIPYGLSDEKKEEHLYKIAFDARKKVEDKIGKFISEKKIDKNSIESIKNDIKIKTAYDSDSLADYIFKRKGTIDLFDRYLEADEKGEYKLESDLHNLIFPMGFTIDDVDYDMHNLWLIDERFATYKYIASDKPLSSISQKKSKIEPDLILADESPQPPQIFDNRLSYGITSGGEINSLVIFEFKRPGETAHQKGKKDYRWEFSDLIGKYFDDFLYSSDKKDHKGKSLRIDTMTPKFGYVILDVIPRELEDFNIGRGWGKTPFGSFFKMWGNLNLHIEVLTFSKLIEFAKMRHNPFFDKLFAV